MNTPLRFEPFLRPMVWGGRQLGDVLGKPLPNGGAYGEAWEISDHPTHASVISHGPGKGQTLRQWMEHQPAALLGETATRHARFPWLVKLLDAWDWLSVQVHPNEADVIRLWPGEGSKTEAWFVLAAAPGSRVYAGLLPGVDEKGLRKALREGTVGDCLHQFSPRPGDCVFLPAGTVHAVGGGVLMAEVQQTSDATFRLFDWNRRDAQGQMRQLHIEEALACIHWNGGPIHPVRARHYPGGADSPSLQPASVSVRQRLVDCSYFSLEYIRYSAPFTCGGSGALQVLLVLHGRGRLWTGEGVWQLAPGSSLLLPAALDALTCHPEGDLGILLSTLPRRT
ncbi:MAG TPA: type I phosphomannose isomerase catalytic subunit [Gemmataceae bacterium]|nr:type I phosphomannose isomerase catalytic subunit [Gemmataceae bacterium]